MIRLFLLSCSMALLCISGASVFYIRETLTREKLRMEKKGRLMEEEEDRIEKRHELDKYYINEFEFWYEELELSNGKTDMRLDCFENMKKIEDQMAREGYDRVEIRDIRQRSRALAQ